MQKAKLAEAERDLATAQSALKDKQAALRAIQKKVADLKRTYEQSLAKRDDLRAGTRVVKYADCIPLFHLGPGLTPMLEVALTQVWPS